jgi:hypothetical protein
VFGEDDGNVDELICNFDAFLSSYQAVCTVSTLTDGNVFSGHFFLGSSNRIPFNASASELEEALGFLSDTAI